jgi:hypothetical protein
MSDRQRYSSVEERLVAIKQVCKGHGTVVVGFDHELRIWRATTPLLLPDGEQASAFGANPGEAIDSLWELITYDRVMVRYPAMPDRFYKWDGTRWIDLIVEPMS